MSQGGFVSNFEWNLTSVFFTHLARTLLMFGGILNQTHVANSHSAFGQHFWFSGKCVFVQKVLKRIFQNTPQFFFLGSSFWPYGYTFSQRVTYPWEEASLRVPEGRIWPNDFQKNLPWGTVLEFRRSDRGGESWHQNVWRPVYIRPSLQFSLTRACIKALSKTLPNIHWATHVPAPPWAPADVVDRIFCTVPQGRFFLKNYLAKFFLRPLRQASTLVVEKTGEFSS